MGAQSQSRYDAAAAEVVILTQCFPPVLGGVETLMGGLADALAASGRRVRVLADAPPPGHTPHGDAARAYDVRRFGGWKPVRRRWKALAGAGAAASAGHVIADSWKSLELARLGGEARVACLAHGMEFPVRPKPEKRRRIQAALAKAQAVLANSQHTAEQVASYAPKGVEIRVVTPPIDPQPEPDPALRAALRTRLGSARPLLATLARLEPRKGIDRVIEAAPRLRARHPGVRLAVAGGGGDRARLEALAAERGVADQVAFLGRVSEAEKAALFAEADLFVMPARREGDSVEGFGIVYLEAAWHGAPAIAGREGGAADAVRDGETGLVCDGADAGAVAAAIEQALEPEARARMSAAAAAHARTQLWARRVAEYLI